MHKNIFIIITSIFLFVSPVFGGSESIEDKPVGGIPIDDNTCFDRTLTISTVNLISAIQIKLDLSHTYRADLDITLTSPTGTAVNLTSDNGGSHSNLSVIFDDTAIDTITGDNSDHTLGTFLPRQPEGSLSDFNGENPQGNWTLEICDDAGIDTGTYNESTLIVNWLQDTDGDGVADINDLDDDNDGILDTQEVLPPISGYDAYWPMDDSFNDDTVNNYDLQGGSANFSTVSTVGIASASFNGVDEYLQYSDGTFLNQAIAAFTYTFWIKPTSLTGIQTLLDEGGKSNGLAIRLDGSSLKCMVSENNSPQVTETFFYQLDGAWHHVAVTYNSGDVILYLDGTASATLSTGFGTLRKHSGAHGFGVTNGKDVFNDGSNTHFYTGLMDDIFHYNVALTEADIKQMAHRSDDSDADGVNNIIDLDSDNDGIPDTVEAQTTGGYTAISSGTNVDANGIPNEVSPSGLTPVDSDSDGLLDFLDDDSDNDRVKDCNEGNANIVTNVLCPLTIVEGNGMSLAAGGSNNYTDVNGNVNDPTTDLVNYVGDTTEVAYREFDACGNFKWNLTSMQWKTISVPCTIDEGIDVVFASLGTYGDSGKWVMYEQTTTYTGKPANDFVSPMSATAQMLPGKGYWIITDHDASVQVDPTVLTTTLTSVSLPLAHAVTSPNFTQVHTFSGLPNSSSTDEQKVMLGNPYSTAFHVGDLFVSNNGGTNFYPLYDTSNTSFTNDTVYIYDDVGTSITNYVPKTAAGTPGFGDAINPGIGFWYRLVSGSTGNNQIDYPLAR